MVSRVRVWLNRTYAENVFFMDQLRRNPCGRAVEIHATHGDPDSPILAAADIAAMEPEGLSPAAYVEYALDQCARHSIDVFVPVLHQTALAGHREEFAAVGTALLAPPAEAVHTFQDKVVAYEAVEKLGVPVPPWWRVRTADELIAAVDELEAMRLQGVLQARLRSGWRRLPHHHAHPLRAHAPERLPQPVHAAGPGRPGAATGGRARGLACHAPSG